MHKIYLANSKMIIGTGVDIDTISSTVQAYQKEGDLFFKQYCTPNEITFIKNSEDPCRYASIIFSIKEAFAKATGQGFSDWLWWDDIELKISKGFQISVRLSKDAMRALEEHAGHRPSKCHASFSECGDVVIAFCILEA